MNWFIRGKDFEGFVDSPTLKEAFVAVVKAQPLSTLGLVLIGSSDYFLSGTVPPEAIAIRVLIPLVEAGIWTEEQAKDFNEGICVERII